MTAFATTSPLSSKFCPPPSTKEEKHPNSARSDGPSLLHIAPGTQALALQAFVRSEQAPLEMISAICTWDRWKRLMQDVEGSGGAQAMRWGVFSFLRIGVVMLVMVMMWGCDSARVVDQVEYPSPEGEQTGGNQSPGVTDDHSGKSSRLTGSGIHPLEKDDYGSTMINISFQAHPNEDLSLRDVYFGIPNSTTHLEDIHLLRPVFFSQVLHQPCLPYAL